MNEGYTNIPNKILKSSKLNSCEKMVLIILKMYMMNKDSCFPSRQLISKETGFYIRSIDKAIKRLIVKRFIKVNRDNGRKNIYKLNF